MFFGGKSFKPETDIPDLAGKVIVVTGGNTGLGKETVLQLAKHNPSQIYLAARTESKAQDAISSIKSTLDSDVDIRYLPLDLTSLESIRSAAKTFTSQSTRLDVLILNAGIMAVPSTKTEAGFEIQLGTNHVGHFLFTKLLLPTLTKTAAEPGSDVRVISVSSEAQNLSPSFNTIISTDKLSASGPWTRYGASKAANIMFAAELARRYPQLKAVSIHPGLILTELYSPGKKTNAFVRYGTSIFGPLLFQTTATGAHNQLWTAAGAKKADLVSGAYYTPVGRVHEGNKWAKNAEYGKKLWDWTEAQLETAGFGA